MAGFDYGDFDAKAEVSPGVDDSLLTDADREILAISIQTAFNRFVRETLPHLTDDQYRQLAARIPLDLMKGRAAPGSNNTYDENFSVADELTLQIQAVQALRQHVFPGGRLKQDANIREAKEVITTCNQMIKTLMDSHERVMNMERFRAVEQSTLDVLSDLGDDLKEKFLERLALKLAEIG